jgi:site-specific DNA-adenine methylase
MTNKMNKKLCRFYDVVIQTRVEYNFEIIRTKKKLRNFPESFRKYSRKKNLRKILLLISKIIIILRKYGNIL